MNDISEILDYPKSVERQELRGEISIEFATTFEQLESMRNEWDDFIESIEGEIFLTFDWCKTWWKYYGKGRRLMIFLFRESDELCGILPMFAEDVGFGPLHLSVIKIISSDFMPVTINFPVKEEMLHRVIPLFISSLNEEYKWDLLFLGALCGRFISIKRLINEIEYISNGAYIVDLQSNDVQTYFPLADSLEEQIAGLSQRQRTKTRRVYKEIQRHGMLLTSSFATKSTLSEWFNDFVKMHQTQWRKVGMPGHFVDWPSSYEFHKEIAEIQLNKNRLRLLQLKLNGSVIGYDYMYKFGQTYQWFLTARSGLEKDSRIDFHRISFGEKVANALKDNVRCIDAGRGEYEYKLIMGGKLFPVNNLLVYRKGFFQNIKIKAFRVVMWIIITLYFKIWRRRFAPRLKIKTGPFWRWGIKNYMLS